jgi:hypothetical protein
VKQNSPGQIYCIVFYFIVLYFICGMVGRRHLQTDGRTSSLYFPFKLCNHKEIIIKTPLRYVSSDKNRNGCKQTRVTSLLPEARRAEALS